jgi:hypothetical protein
MIVQISSDAELDILEGYRFYEDQSPGLGEYFRDSVLADIDALAFFAGIHERAFGHHRMLCKTFPYAVYYDCDASAERVTVIAVVDCRRNPSWTRDRLM